MEVRRFQESDAAGIADLLKKDRCYVACDGDKIIGYGCITDNMSLIHTSVIPEYEGHDIEIELRKACRCYP